MKKRILSFLLALCLLFSTLPVSVFATGSCGNNLIWRLSDDGVLTISGTGKMLDWTTASQLPWCDVRDEIRSVVIEEGVTTIGDNAFLSCTNMTSVSIPSTITYIGEYAFFECESLTTAVIPNGVKIIKEGTFWGCTGLESITIPASVASIDFCAFYLCAGLKNVTIPGKVTIGEYAFEECTALSTVTFSGASAKIGNSAFLNCANLTTVSFPAKVTQIGTFAFSGCSRLERANIPEGLTVIEEYAFSRCTSLNTVSIPNTVTAIREGAFSNSTALQEITIPGSVTSLGNFVFNCTGLKEIFFEGSAPAFNGSSVFGDVTATAWYDGEDATWTKSVMKDYGGKITWTPYASSNGIASGTCGDNLVWVLGEDGVLTISGTGDMDTYDQPYYVPWHDYRSAVKAIVVEEGVTSLGQYAFIDCANTLSVQIPRSVTVIEDSVFAGCGSLSSVELPDTLVSIGATAFSQCRGLETLTIPGSVASMGTAAFQHCYGLKSVVIQEGVTVIGSCAFNGSYSLSQITLPDTLVSIEDNAFGGCDLREIRLSDGLRRIREYAFSGNYELREITIPEGVTDIGNGLFANCTGLKEVCFRGDAPEFDGIFFHQVTATVYYPADNATWTSHIGQNYGGTITWAPANCERLDREHNWETQRTAPTCTEQGYTTHTCTACGDGYVDSYVDASGHRFWEGWSVIDAASCIKAGLEGRTCIVCDYTETRSVAPLGHSYQSRVTEPTCDQAGCTTHTCTGCGDSYVDSYVNARGHDFRAEWRVINAAGCTQDGLEGRDCISCGYTETRSVAPLGHSYQSRVTEPTCDQAGYTTHTCTTCGANYTDGYTSALGHTAGESVSENMVQPTCTAGGRYDLVTRCAVCNAELERTTCTLPAAGHSYSMETVDPTCTQRGYTTHTCHCGHSFKDSYVAAAGHSWSAWRMIKEPTNAEAGLQERICTACGETERQEIPRLEVVCGDANGDNKVNALDLILIRQYLAGWEITPDMSAADLNGDGKVNALDLIRLRQYLAGWDVTLGR